MNRNGWMLALLLIGSVSLLLLPRLAGSGLPGKSEYVVEAFGGEQGIVLDEGNLVDVIGRLPSALPVDRVSWESGVLSLDLKLSGEAEEPAVLYADMANAITYALQGTVNVEQLLLRIVSKDYWTGASSVLLAADARRSDRTLELLPALRGTGDRPLSRELKSAFRISESDLWRNQFIPPGSG